MSRIIDREVSLDEPDESVEQAPVPDPDEDVDDKQVRRVLAKDTPRRRGRPKKEESLPEEEKPPAPSVDKAHITEISKLRTIANGLVKELAAVGTGLVIDSCDDVALLEAEIAALDANLDGRRGRKAIKSTFLMLVTIFENVATKTIPTAQLDVGAFPYSKHLRQEIDENWEMFEEAAKHLAIRHAAWFAVGPYGELAQGLATCASNVNTENQKRRIKHAADAPK